MLKQTTPECGYEFCDNSISPYTRHGNKIPPGRLKKMKYCSDSCSRLQVTLEKRREREAAFKAADIYNRFIGGWFMMAIKIIRRDYDSGQYVQRIQDLWKKIDRSEIDRQRVASYLRGLQIAATKGRHPDWDEELQLLIDVVRVRE